MKRIEFWFDVISPYAWLAFQRLPQALEGVNVEVANQPVGACMRHRLMQGLATSPSRGAAIRLAPRRPPARRSGPAARRD